MITMKYPYDSKNENYDGQEHEIDVQDLIQIDKTNFYYLNYYDKQLKKDMGTFLKKVANNQFYKIPLADYSQVNNYFQQLNLTIVDKSILGKNIQLGEQTTIADLFIEIKTYKQRFIQATAVTSPAGPPNPPTPPNNPNNNYNQGVKTQVQTAGSTPHKRNGGNDYSSTNGYKQFVEFICYNSHTKDLLTVFGQPTIEESDKNIKYIFNESPNENEIRNDWSFFDKSSLEKSPICSASSVDNINKKMYLLYFVPVYKQEKIEMFESGTINSVSVIKNRNSVSLAQLILFDAVNGHSHNVTFETNPSFHV
ncbi:MAG: hypothetical protein IJR82_05065 [Bacilli bacterium]|nr:hypothetical protein [Bacilli bacterium]